VSHGAVPNQLAEATRSGLSPVARRLVAIGVTANAVTVIGGALTLIGGGLVALAMPLPALVVLIVGALADTLDGQIAKASGGGTKFGAFLDSTVDRVADAALFGGAALLAAASAQAALLWWSLIALVATFLVPYVRAKAESLGLTATVGPAPREARVVIFLLGLAAWAIFDLEILFIAAVLAVALLASITVATRVAAVGRQLQIKGR
jgi:phosphatidylinositol phosphate synthase